MITSPASGSIQINLDSSEFDAYLQLLDANSGQLIAFDDDGGSGANAQLSFTAEAGEDYLIRATSFWSFETGGYRLTTHIESDSEPELPVFDSVYGYGLVDAASAVAEAIGQSRFDDVADIGGNQWNNDMVNAPEVWAQGYTGQGVTVAVIDSGVDIAHEDLRDNIWINPNEIAGDGIDNDNNGYIDDIHGWNFGVGQNNNDVSPGTDDPGQGHGTHVAGTIAAANNSFGMTGVAHNANIMAIRMGDTEGGSYTNAGDLAQAIRYAVDNGTDVINLSLNGPDIDGSIRDALAYAASHDVIAVMSAGNNSHAAPDTPAYHATDYGISVGAVDRNGDLALFSNRAGTDSRMHHVMAPGQEVYSTLPNNTYAFSQGTSMAAPHVAGVVALMLSANPNLTHDQVREILTETAIFKTLNPATTGVPTTTVDLQQVEQSGGVNTLIGQFSGMESSWGDYNFTTPNFDHWRDYNFTTPNYWRDYNFTTPNSEIIVQVSDGAEVQINLPERIIYVGSQMV